MSRPLETLMVRLRLELGRDLVFTGVKQSHIKEDRKKEREEGCGRTERKRDQKKEKTNVLTLFHPTDECLTFVDKNYNYVFVCL